MTLADIFEINDPICIEPAIMDCADSEYTRFLLDGDYSAAKLLVDENEDPIAAAFLEEGGWTVTSFVFRPFSVEVLERIEALDGDIYQEERSNYLAALREYYCGEIVREFPDVIEDNREGRAAEDGRHDGAVVGEETVGFVRKDEDRAFAPLVLRGDERREGVDRRLRVDAARRVVRGVEEDGAGLVRDGRLNGVEVEVEGGLL